MTDRAPFDPWRVLGVPRRASQAEVARAYRALAKQFHPDLHGADADRRMRDLNRAFEMLSDPARWIELDGIRSDPTVAHWSAAPRGRSAESAGQPAGPAAWAAWEAGPRTDAPAAARVQSVRSWRGNAPRSEGASAPPRDSPIAAVLVALTIVVAVIGLGWVASTSGLASNPREAFRQSGVTPSNSVPLDAEHTIAVFQRPDGTLGLAAAWLDEGGWQGRVLVEAVTSHPYSVFLFDARDAPLGRFQTIVYGRSRADVEHVELEGQAVRGGTVANGTWALAVPEALTVQALDWRFVAADGSVVLAGRGELLGR